jgi:hypothetical protein
VRGNARRTNTLRGSFHTINKNSPIELIAVRYRFKFGLQAVASVSLVNQGLTSKKSPCEFPSLTEDSQGSGELFAVNSTADRRVPYEVTVRRVPYEVCAHACNAR